MYYFVISQDYPTQQQIHYFSLNMDEATRQKMLLVFNNFNEYIEKPENSKKIPIKIQQKLKLLQQCILDPSTQPDPVDYDQLQSDERTQLSKLPIDSKKQIYLDIIHMFMKQTKIVGTLEILGKSSIIWSDKSVEIDLDKKQLTIQRQNPTDPPHVVPLREYSFTYKGNNFGRYQYVLLSDDPKTAIKEIVIGGSDRDEMAQWSKYFNQCCKSSLLSEPEKDDAPVLRPHLKTVAFSVLEPSRKLSDEPIEAKRPLKNRTQTMVQPNSDRKQDLPNRQLSPLQKRAPPPSKKQQPNAPTQPSPIKSASLEAEPILLPSVFEDLRPKLNYEFLINDENFRLIQFDQFARIMQSKENECNYRIFVSLPKVPLEILITALYDPYAQMKWNQQIRSQKITLQASATLAQIEECRAALSAFYFSRTFKYLRYIHTEQDQFFIIERSYETNVKNGKIEWSISGVFLRDGQCKLMIVDTLTYNQGYLTKHQDSQLTLQYLKQYTMLKQYLKEEKRKNLIKDANQPLFVNEVIQQFKRYGSKFVELSKKSEGGKDEPQPTPIETAQSPKQQQQPLPPEVSDTEDEEEDDPLHKDPFIYQDCRPESEKKSRMVLPPNFDDSELEQSLMIMTESFDQYLKRLLQDVSRNLHYKSQIHYFNIMPHKGQQNIRIEKAENGHWFYRQDWVYDEKKGCLKFINQKKLEAQKNVFKYILSKIGANILQGKSILNISLPVYVFETKTNLQRFADSFAFAPHFFEPVAKKSPLEQMKAVLAFSISMTLGYLSLDKPFNPILGETYQCWIKGSPLYMEQISHHPPIASFLMLGVGYRFYGHLETVASIGANTVTGGNNGVMTVEFETGAKIDFTNCKGYLTGITYGDRNFYLEGTMLFVDYVTHQVAELSFQQAGFFGKKVSMDYYEGKIYKTDQKESQKYQKEGYKRYKGLQGNAQNYPCIGSVEGTWQNQGNNMNVDGKCIFNIMTDFPFQVFPEEMPLASDSQYREDLIAWRMNNFDLAMERKEKLENIQRNDRKWRAKFQGH